MYACEYTLYPYFHALIRKSTAEAGLRLLSTLPVDNFVNNYLITA